MECPSCSQRFPIANGIPLTFGFEESESETAILKTVKSFYEGKPFPGYEECGEPFRPFAPAVVASAASEYFQVDQVDDLYPARFMLYVVPVADGRRDVIPATTHVDGTARLQVVHDESTRYHQLISAFGQATGVPVLLNTSFNLRGSPSSTALKTLGPHSTKAGSTFWSWTASYPRGHEHSKHAKHP